MKVSLRVKLSIGLILVCLLMGAFSTLAVRNIAEDIVDKEYSTKAEQVAQAVVNTIDPRDAYELSEAVRSIYSGIDNVVISTEWGSDEWNDYIANYNSIYELPVFNKLRDHFRIYQDIFQVDCIYIVYYEKDVKHSLYIIDAAPDEDACPPGCVDSFDDGIWPEKTDIVIPASLTNTEEYGWLVTGGYLISYNGEYAGHLCVDISMNDIKAKERSYVVTISLIMAGLTIVLLILSLIYFNRSFVRPMRMLSNTAKNYCSENNDVVHHTFEKLEIRSHDEIGELLSSMKQMEADMNANIDTLVNTKVALQATEEKANTMQALAVKDALTGVRNKTAYDYEAGKLEVDLADGFNEFGLAMVDLNFLKRTNDTYGHEKGNISIRRLCNLVCEIFEHSPVFRIGGDEFVVILRNRDYRGVDGLINDFNKRLEALQRDDTLQPWEQISAAIGYAKFDKTVDKTVEDVFKKADKAMYDRKVAMKAERKD